MAQRVFIINGKEPDGGGVGGVADNELSHVAVNFFTPGVIAEDDYKVEAQATPDMTVKVNSGKAYVKSSSGEMLYATHLDTDTNASISNNSSGNDRIDAVVIKIDTATTPDRYGENIVSIEVVEGTPAASPVAPTDSEIQTAVGAGNAFLRLADVTVENGTVSITGSDISNARESVTRKHVPNKMVAATDGSTVTFDRDEGEIHTVTLGGNRTLALSNMRVGSVIMLRLKQDGTGNRTVTWFSGINWVNGEEPTLTTTANKTDVFGFLCTGTDTYDGYIVGQNL